MHEYKSFEEFSAGVTADAPTLVDFYAPWCGPCRAVAPYLDELAAKTPKVKFAKVNIDELADVADAFKVHAVPTFVLFKNGSVVGTVRGANKEAVRKLVSTAA